MFSTNEDRRKAVDTSPKISRVTSVLNAKKRAAINPIETPEMMIAKMKEKDCDKSTHQIFQLSDECSGSSIGEAPSPTPPTPEPPKLQKKISAFSRNP